MWGLRFCIVPYLSVGLLLLPGGGECSEGLASASQVSLWYRPFFHPPNELSTSLIQVTSSSVTFTFKVSHLGCLINTEI